MGEKGLAASGSEAVSATGLTSTVTETTGNVVSDASDALKNRLIDTGVDHVIDEGRERLRRGGEAPPEPPPSA